MREYNYTGTLRIEIDYGYEIPAQAEVFLNGVIDTLNELKEGVTVVEITDWVINL